MLKGRPKGGPSTSIFYPLSYPRDSGGGGGRGSRLGTSENETPLSPQPDGGEGREQPVSEAFFGGRKEEKKDDDEQEAGMHVGVRLFCHFCHLYIFKKVLSLLSSFHRKGHLDW